VNPDPAYVGYLVRMKIEVNAVELIIISRMVKIYADEARNNNYTRGYRRF